MIPISEVLEEAAQIIDQQDVDPAFKHRMSSHIRALAAKYEGCIVAEGAPAVLLFKDEDGRDQIMAADSHPYFVDIAQAAPLYRAKEPK